MKESEANLKDKLIEEGPGGHPLLGDDHADDSDREIPVNGPGAQSGLPQNSGFTGGAHNKKRQGTEDAQKRSDTGTGL